MKLKESKEDYVEGYGGDYIINFLKIKKQTE